MCQAKRQRPSPADRQAEALADVERIAQALFEAIREVPEVTYGTVSVVGPPQLRAVVTRLLHRDVIRVGRRPVVEEPMVGQTTIDDA